MRAAPPRVERQKRVARAAAASQRASESISEQLAAKAIRQFDDAAGSRRAFLMPHARATQRARAVSEMHC
eukprot:11192390-Lingulodinium_polyedra.AAC.1